MAMKKAGDNMEARKDAEKNKSKKKFGKQLFSAATKRNKLWAQESDEKLKSGEHDTESVTRSAKIATEPQA